VRDRVVLFIAWGERHLQELVACLAGSRLPDCRVVLITDTVTSTTLLPSRIEIIRRPFRWSGKERKSEALADLPDGFGTTLFLDVDTRVIGDISLGFDKAERHGIAMAPAPHYSLADFRGFGSVMAREGISPRGQMIYNSGVIFLTPEFAGVRAIFAAALALALKDPAARFGDQPYLTLAMEIAGFNPYTLSPSFNHRAFGELISGSIRVWHSYCDVPADAGQLEPGFLHRYQHGTLVRALPVPL
jgi:hypothetical protein